MKTRKQIKYIFETLQRCINDVEYGDLICNKYNWFGKRFLLERLKGERDILIWVLQK